MANILASISAVKRPVNIHSTVLYHANSRSPSGSFAAMVTQLAMIRSSTSLSNQTFSTVSMKNRRIGLRVERQKKVRPSYRRLLSPSWASAVTIMHWSQLRWQRMLTTPGAPPSWMTSRWSAMLFRADFRASSMEERRMCALLLASAVLLDSEEAWLAGMAANTRPNNLLCLASLS
jgi:hypothetical protein